LFSAFRPYSGGSRGASAVWLYDNFAPFFFRKFASFSPRQCSPVRVCTVRLPVEMSPTSVSGARSNKTIRELREIRKRRVITTYLRWGDGGGKRTRGRDANTRRPKSNVRGRR